MKNILIMSCLALLALNACNKVDDIVMPEPAQPPVSQLASVSFVNEGHPGEVETTLAKGTTSLTYKLSVGKSALDVQPVLIKPDSKEFKDAFSKYVKFKHLPYLSVIPAEKYEVNVPIIKAGETSGEVTVKVKEYGELPFGRYLLPIFIKVNGEIFPQFINVVKEGEYVPLSETNKKPLPPNYPNYKEPMKMIAYVETNDWDIRNYGQFILKESKKPVFDYIVLFAANMNYDAVKKKRYVFFNDKLQPIINNPEVYIKPLQERGIKVIIDILPNHQGVGYHNFQSYEDAKAFVEDMKYWTEKLGIDGWDIDEEYADYDKEPNLQHKGWRSAQQSAFWFCQAYKDVMPDKWLTLYQYGLMYNKRKQPLDDRGNTLDHYIDYSVANYGTPSELYGISKEKFAAYSIEANWAFTPSSLEYAAKFNLDKGYSGLMFFNISGARIYWNGATSVLNSATQLFYGEDCVFSGTYFPGPKDKPNVDGTFW